MTASATPSDRLSDLINEAVKRHMAARAEAIERVCAVAFPACFGVRLKDYSDGRYEVYLDSTVPAREIYHEHPDQPHYGIIFEED